MDESIAVGSQTFIEGNKEKLNLRVKGRKVTKSTDHYQLREPSPAYNAHFRGENGPLSIENRFYLGLKVEESDG